MSDEEIASHVGRMIDDARSYMTTEIEPKRKLSTEYYKGAPFGNEEDGRSSVVSTDVRDVILSMMPSFMRIFAGSHERAVEFRPRGPGPEDEAEARQKTDMVNYVIFEENDGFMTAYSAIKDALLRQCGLFKWWVVKETRTTGQNYTGLTEAAMTALAMEDGVELEITKTIPASGEVPETYDCKITRTVTENVIKVRALNPSHLAWNRGARTFEDALIVVHDEEIRVDEMLAMGYKLEDFKDCIGPSQISADDSTGSDAAARVDDGAGIEIEDAVLDETRPVRYSESYVFGSFEKGKGTSLWKVCTAGDTHKFLAKERVEERPFASLVVDPESHQILGNDIADLTRDTQLIKSNILRATLDSLAKAVDPDTVVGNGVTLDDVVSKERSKVIRADDVDQVKEFSHRFVGDVTLPMLEHMDQVQEKRTGRKGEAGGLDADALQSTAKTAAAAILSASQQRVELIARIFAETGWRRLVRGVGKLLHQHQNQKKTVRLRGKWTEVDPRSWNSNMDVVVNVALGSGTSSDRIQSLMAIKSDQDAIMAALGVGNPLVTPSQARNTRARLVIEAGFRNPEEFYSEITPEQEQMMLQAAAEAPKQPQGDPALMAQAQNDARRLALDEQKFQAQKERDEAEIHLKKMEIEMRDARERDKQGMEFALKIAQIEAETGAKINRQAVEAEAKAQRDLLDSATSIRREEISAEAKRDVAAINASAKKETDGKRE